MTENIKKMFKLAKVLFKGSSFSNASSNGLKKNNNKWMYIVLPICFIPIIMNMIGMLIMGFEALRPLGDDYLIIRTYLTLSSLVTLMLGFFYAISILFFSNDNDILSHLPIHSWQICGARFLVILIYEYIFEAFIFVPFVITYGIMANAGVLFFIYALIAGIILPVLPISVLSVIAMLLMRFIPFFKSKDKVNILSSILFVVMVFTLYVPFINSMSSADESNVGELFYMIAQGPDSIAAILEYILPTLGFSFGALYQYSTIYGLINIFLAVIVSFAAFIFFMAIANILYQKAASGIMDSKAKHKSLSNAELSQKLHKTSSLKALVAKEIRLGVRSPVCFMNCIITPWIFPLIFGVLFLMQSDIQTGFAEIQQFASQNSINYMPYILAGVASFTAFISSTSAFAATAISREGTQISFSKMLPVSYYTQLKAKLYAALLLCGLPTVLWVFAAAIAFSCGIICSIFVVLTALITFMYTSCIGLLIDMGRPKLIWDNEQAAVKQNFNSLITIAFSLPVAIIIIGASIVVANIFNMGAVVASIIHLLLAGLALALLIFMIKKGADKCYNNIQI